MRIDDRNHAEKKPARGLQLTSRTLPMEELSEEMIMEILLRLPARTLCCMKSVCSSWRTLISSPDFTWNHVRRSSSLDSRLTPPRIAYDKFDGIGVLSVQSLLDNDPSEPTKVAHFRAEWSYRIVGYCHGMLCLLHDDNDIGGHMHALLWNPCTGFTFLSPQIRGYANFCGFGYDHLNDTYKFCGIIRNLGPSGFENSARIYTFGPNSPWRIIDDIPTDEDLSMADNKKGVYFGSSRECTLNWSFFHVVYYFDLGKETYGHFALPDRDSSDHYDPWRRRGHCLWQMKEYGDAQS
ncbi:hypothetical protein PIB30_003103 [Stylosanthes scabra]|uniref:F-box domain-containing protein n=1 Tax=Stylosanthes scabra TaxID=79078 RepID=A0ABU6Y1G8_9FABA|nr:hypothetical protein [Stylosanthes scabra]